MTTRSEAFITSVEVRQGPAHDYVTIWIRHQSVGTLCLGKGDGEELRTVLLAGEASTHPPELTPWQGALDAMRDEEGEPCPPGLQPDAATLELAERLGFDRAQLIEQVKRFLDYERMHDRRRHDWQLPLRRWLQTTCQCRTFAAADDPRVRAQRRISRALSAEAREVEQRMVERAGNWLAHDAIGQAVVAAISDGSISMPVPLFEGPCPHCGFKSTHGTMCIACGVRFAVIDHPVAEAGQGAPAPSPPAANEEPGMESRPPGAPPAAGAPRSFHNVCLECWKANAAGPPPPELGTFTNLICHSCGQRAARGVLIDVTPTPAYNTWRRRLMPIYHATDAAHAERIIEQIVHDDAWRDEETIG